MQGKIEFSIRSAGYIVRKLNYTKMFSRPDKIVTKEELERFEKALEGNKIPDGLRIGAMYDMFEHYDQSSFMSTILFYGGLALGVVVIAIMIYMGISRFCPRLVGKQVGVAYRAKDGGINIKIDNRTGTPDDGHQDGGGVELDSLTGGHDEQREQRERATSMSLKRSIITPNSSRRLIRNMTVAQRKTVCESADRIRSVDGYRTYDTESEESGDESEKGNKKVQFLKDKYKGEFTNMVCKNCVKALEECRCAEGVIPSWQQGCCKFCMRDEEHCICEEGFTALKDGDLKSPQKL